MDAFENVAIATMRVPTSGDVLGRIRREEPCHAQPASERCNFGAGRDAYLLKDQTSREVCEQCPLFSATWEKMAAEWDNWVIEIQDAYT